MQKGYKVINNNYFEGGDCIAVYNRHEHNLVWNGKALYSYIIDSEKSLYEKPTGVWKIKERNHKAKTLQRLIK